MYEAEIAALKDTIAILERVILLYNIETKKFTKTRFTKQPKIRFKLTNKTKQINWSTPTQNSLTLIKQSAKALEIILNVITWTISVKTEIKNRTSW